MFNLLIDLRNRICCLELSYVLFYNLYKKKEYAMTLYSKQKLINNYFKLKRKDFILI